MMDSYVLYSNWIVGLAMIGMFVSAVLYVVQLRRRDHLKAKRFLSSYASSAQVAVKDVVFTMETISGNSSSRIRDIRGDFYFFEKDVVLVAKTKQSPWSFCVALRAIDQPVVERESCEMITGTIRQFHVCTNIRGQINLSYGEGYYPQWRVDLTLRRLTPEQVEVLQRRSMLLGVKA
jgi:hypothetical protein